VFKPLSKILLFSLLLSPFAHGEDDFVDPFQAHSDAPHSLQVLNSGLAAMEKRLQLVESAKETIDLEMFIYNTDKAGRMFTQALVKKAQEGVRVRLLFDHFMIGSTISPYHAHELERHGIIVRFYNKASLLRAKAQYRNHRKSLIIDGKVAVVGGRNIADEYFDLSEEYNFVDRDLSVEGEIVSAIAQSFQEVWDSKYVIQIDRDRKPRPNDIKYLRSSRDSGRMSGRAMYSEDIRHWNKYVQEAQNLTFQTQEDKALLQHVRTLGKDLLANEHKDTCNKSAFYSDKPGHGRRHRREGRLLKHEIFERLKAVKDSVLIDTPYFISDDDSRPVLDNLLDAGKKVDVLTNGVYSTDAIYVATVFYHYFKRWLRGGLKPFIYQGDALNYYPTVSEGVQKSRWGTHSKTFVFDNDSSMIGSYNFDPRSNVYSLELAYFCDGNETLASSIRSDIEARMAQSYHLDDVDSFKEHRFERVGLFKKIGFYALKFPSLLLQGLL
tara:strand:- start:12068 stop:13552 length:1485 start_codon:yes stop_codon:yes gene_type:complete